jgi:hypothetical protein
MDRICAIFSSIYIFTSNSFYYHAQHESKVLLDEGFYLPTTYVEKKYNVGWNTAKKYLTKMYSLYWITKLERGNHDYWRAYRK